MFQKIPTLDLNNSRDGIVPIPVSAQDTLKLGLSRYSNIISPEGRPIHFLAQTSQQDCDLLFLRRSTIALLFPYPKIMAHLAKKEPVIILLSDQETRRQAAENLSHLEQPHLVVCSNSCFEEGLLAFVYEQSFKHQLPFIDRLVNSAAQEAWSHGKGVWKLSESDFESFLERDVLSTEYIRRLVMAFYGHGTSDYVPASQKELKNLDAQGFELIRSLVPLFFHHPNGLLGFANVDCLLN